MDKTTYVISSRDALIQVDSIETGLGLTHAFSDIINKTN